MTVILTAISLFLPKTFEKMTSSATIKVTKKNEKFLNTLAKWMSGLDELRRYASFNIFSESVNQSADEYKKAAIHQGATIAMTLMTLKSLHLLYILHLPIKTGLSMLFTTIQIKRAY